MIFDLDTAQPRLTLQCPACAQPLPVTPRGLACPACGAAWPVEGGVWRFGEHSGYPLDFSPEQTAELVAIAEQQGWQVALHDQMRAWSPARYRRAVDEYGAQWRCLLPRPPAGSVLDFRCGWGTTAAALAEDFQDVVAAETNYPLARFTALRCAAAGRTNVQAVSLDPRQRLPFPPGAFDVVILHGVLEWSTRQTVPAAALLREAVRVLRSDGRLFLLAGNRLNPMGRLSRPRRAEAGGQPAPARPQPAAHARTLRGYQRLLAEAGLETENLYGLVPAAEEPFYMIPADQPGAIRFFLDSNLGSPSLRRALSQRHLLAAYQAARLGWSAAQFLPLEGLAAHFMPGYGLVARRRPPQPASAQPGLARA